MTNAVAAVRQSFAGTCVLRALQSYMYMDVNMHTCIMISMLVGTQDTRTTIRAAFKMADSLPEVERKAFTKLGSEGEELTNQLADLNNRTLVRYTNPVIA